MPIENPFNISPPERPIDPGAKIGHVHLKVANIPRALEFYIGVLGFQLVMPYGDQAAFISAGGYHHQIHIRVLKHLFIVGAEVGHIVFFGLFLSFFFFDIASAIKLELIVGSDVGKMHEA